MHEWKTSRFTVEVPVVDPQYSEKFTALYQTMTGGFILMPEDEWVNGGQGLWADGDPELMDALWSQGFLVDAAADERLVYDCWMQQHVHDFSTITSKTMVTRKCNNRCTYCILDPEAKEMSAYTARAVDAFYTDFIAEKRPLRVMDDYLGGEPLLKAGMVIESAARRGAFCRRKGIDYQFTFTTNGLLLKPELVKKFTAAGLSGIRVSLAGPRDVHDRLRPTRNQGNTYDRIMANLQQISGMVPITIECQYDSGSDDYRRLPEMLDDLTARGIDIKEVHFSPILQKRGSSDFTCGLGDAGIALDLMKLAGQYGWAPEREAPASLCRADFRSMLVFDTNGSLIPCPGLREGEMAYGDAERGVDFVAESQLLHRRLPEKCANDCALLPLCMGGCRLQALVRENDFSGIDCQHDMLMLFLKDFILEKAAEALAEEESELLEIAA